MEPSLVCLLRVVLPIVLCLLWSKNGQLNYWNFLCRSLIYNDRSGGSAWSRNNKTYGVSMDDFKVDHYGEYYVVTYKDFKIGDPIEEEYQAHKIADWLNNSVDELVGRGLRYSK